MESINIRKETFESVPLDFTQKNVYHTGFIHQHKKLTKQVYTLKRAIDISVACIFIIVLLTWISPLLFLIIKLDSKGSFIFRQLRVGQNGKLFQCFKFRTMHPNEFADVLQVCENDTRITRVGKLLRKFHIDELLQLINILKGDMSLVGPRPHMVADDKVFESMVPHYNMRNNVKPGLTGLAQVKGFYGPTPDFHSIYFRTRLDHFYVSKVSFMLDLKIIFSTLRVPLSK